MFDREDIKWICQGTLCDSADKVVQESKQKTLKKYILEEATYEQILNLCYNAGGENLIESTDLEQLAYNDMMIQLAEALLFEETESERERKRKLKYVGTGAGIAGGLNLAVQSSNRAKLKKHFGKDPASFGQRAMGFATDVAIGAGIGYIVYRLNRKKGASVADAANKAAAAEQKKGNKEKAAKWKAKAAQAKG